MAELKSKAHPEWPYSGTAHEWRGFANSGDVYPVAVSPEFYEALKQSLDPWTEIRRKAAKQLGTIYQKQNFGPELD